MMTNKPDLSKATCAAVGGVLDVADRAEVRHHEDCRHPYSGAQAIGRSMCFRILKVARLVLTVWPERHRQRASLLELEPQHLRDIGKSHAEAMREGRKPFWR